MNDLERSYSNFEGMGISENLDRGYVFLLGLRSGEDLSSPFFPVGGTGIQAVTERAKVSARRVFLNFIKSDKIFANINNN